MKIRSLQAFIIFATWAHVAQASETPPSLTATNTPVPGQAGNMPDEQQIAYINDIARLNDQISTLNFQLKDASPARVAIIDGQIRDLTIELKQKNLNYQKTRLEQSSAALEQGERSLAGNEKEFQEQVISRQQNDIARLEAELNELKSKQ